MYIYIYIYAYVYSFIITNDTNIFLADEGLSLKGEKQKQL